MAETAITLINANKAKIAQIVESEKFKSQLVNSLAQRMSPDFVMRAAMSAIGNNDKILECTPRSIAASILVIAQAGLAPDPWKQHAYLIPRSNKISKKGEPDKWEMQCTAMLGYRGFVHIAYKSPKVARAAAYPVYEGDIFDVDLASGERPTHKAWVRPETGREQRGKLIGAYAFVTLKSGESLVEWMTVEDIEAVRKRSKAADSGPWVTDYAEMARKTPFRRLFKWVPDEDMQAAAAKDELAEFGLTETYYDPETGELVTRQREAVEEAQQRPKVAMPQAKVQQLDEPKQQETVPQDMPKTEAEPVEVKQEAVVTRDDGKAIEGGVDTVPDGAEDVANFIASEGTPEPPTAQELFDKGTIKKGVVVDEKKPGTIGKTEARKLHTAFSMNGKRTGWTEEKFIREILTKYGYAADCEFRDIKETDFRNLKMYEIATGQFNPD